MPYLFKWFITLKGLFPYIISDFAAEILKVNGSMDTFIGHAGTTNKKKD